jgi:hypothetical protein
MSSQAIGDSFAVRPNAKMLKCADCKMLALIDGTHNRRRHISVNIG